jgi:UDP-glucose 4-epimerase
MNAAVTGGAGFIGSHLVDRLLTDSWSVLVIDNMSCGHKANLQHHEGNRKLQILKADIRDAEAMQKLLKGCDTVFHMAAHANIEASLGDPKIDLENNVIGTINMLNAKVNHIHELVFASTSAV